jgi:hypothetical protein
MVSAPGLLDDSCGRVESADRGSRRGVLRIENEILSPGFDDLVDMGLRWDDAG